MAIAIKRFIKFNICYTDMGSTSAQRTNARYDKIWENSERLKKEIQEKTDANISKIFNPNNRIKRIEKEISDMIKEKR